MKTTTPFQGPLPISSHECRVNLGAFPSWGACRYPSDCQVMGVHVISMASCSYWMPWAGSCPSYARSTCSEAGEGQNVTVQTSPRVQQTIYHYHVSSDGSKITKCKRGSCLVAAWCCCTRATGAITQLRDNARSQIDAPRRDATPSPGRVLLHHDPVFLRACITSHHVMAATTSISVALFTTFDLSFSSNHSFFRGTLDLSLVPLNFSSASPHHASPQAPRSPHPQVAPHCRGRHGLLGQPFPGVTMEFVSVPSVGLRG